jgi:hypothetical protein
MLLDVIDGVPVTELVFCLWDFGPAGGNLGWLFVRQGEHNFQATLVHELGDIAKHSGFHPFSRITGRHGE